MPNIPFRNEENRPHQTWLRAVLEKLTFPEDVIVTVDVDPYPAVAIFRLHARRFLAALIAPPTICKALLRYRGIATGVQGRRTPNEAKLQRQVR